MGPGKTRLTFSDWYKTEPTWSPDGQKLASYEARRTEIRVVNADGTGRLADLWTAPPNEFVYARGLVAGRDHAIAFITHQPRRMRRGRRQLLVLPGPGRDRT